VKTMPSKRHFQEYPDGRLAVFIPNAGTAVVGGLSLVFATASPLMLGLSFSPGTVRAAAMIGGSPLACAAAIVLSQWLLHRRHAVAAMGIAWVGWVMAMFVVAWVLLAE